MSGLPAIIENMQANSDRILSQNDKEVDAQKETSELIRQLIQKMGLLQEAIHGMQESLLGMQEATEDDTESREKETRDEERRSGGRAAGVVAGVAVGFRKFKSGLDRGTAAVSNFGKGLKNALSGMIETFSFSNLKKVILSPLKLVGPALILGLGSALIGGNALGGGLLAAGAATGNPIFMLAGALTLLVTNLKTIIPFIKNLADPQYRQEQFDKVVGIAKDKLSQVLAFLSEKLDPNQPGNVWRFIGENIPGLLAAAFGRIREIISGALSTLPIIGKYFKSDTSVNPETGEEETKHSLLSTGVATAATYEIARRVIPGGKLLPGTGTILKGGYNAAKTGINAVRATQAATAATTAALPAATAATTAATTKAATSTAATATQTASTAARSGSRLASFGKFALRGLSKAALPLTVAMGVFDAYKGFVADENASLLQKTGNALSSVANGLSFGLVGKSASEIEADAAGNAEQLADTVISDQQQYLQQNPMPVQVVNDGGGNIISSNQNVNNNQQSTVTNNMPQIVPNNPLYTSLF